MPTGRTLPLCWPFLQRWTAAVVVAVFDGRSVVAAAVRPASGVHLCRVVPQVLGELALNRTRPFRTQN